MRVLANSSELVKLSVPVTFVPEFPTLSAVTVPSVTASDALIAFTVELSTELFPDIDPM